MIRALTGLGCHIFIYTHCKSNKSSAPFPGTNKSLVPLPGANKFLASLPATNKFLALCQQLNRLQNFRCAITYSMPNFEVTP